MPEKSPLTSRIRQALRQPKQPPKLSHPFQVYQGQDLEDLGEPTVGTTVRTRVYAEGDREPRVSAEGQRAELLVRQVVETNRKLDGLR